MWLETHSKMKLSLQLNRQAAKLDRGKLELGSSRGHKRFQVLGEKIITKRNCFR